VCDTVEAETGAPCLFLQGAAGDLSARSDGLEGAEEFGRVLGREALVVARTARSLSAIRPSLQAAEEDFCFPSRADLNNPLIRFAFERAFFPDLVRFYRQEYRDGVRPHLTVALVNGRLGLVGVSGEFFCEHALSLRRRARLEQLLFLGYCNDYQQYFPTIEAAAEGGYGTGAGLATAQIGAGEAMMNRALITLYRMRGELAD